MVELYKINIKIEGYKNNMAVVVELRASSLAIRALAYCAEERGSEPT